MADVVIRSVRIFKVENSGDLSDKCNKDVELTIQYDPQGINLKIDSGKSVRSVHPHPKPMREEKNVSSTLLRAAATAAVCSRVFLLIAICQFYLFINYIYIFIILILPSSSSSFRQWHRQWWSRISHFIAHRHRSHG